MSFMDALLRDGRNAARLLRRNPIFTATAALSLAIGIGATTAIFTVANGLLLRSVVGVADPGTLVDVVRAERGGGPGVFQISYPHYLDIRRRTTTLVDVYAFQLLLNPSSLRVGESMERVFPTAVSTNYFEVLGVRPAAGRLFGRAESDRPLAAPVVVLSHRFWDRRFGRDASVIGQTVRIGSLPFTVVGVAAEAFRGTTVAAPDLWVPIGMIAAIAPEDGERLLTMRGVDWLMLGARLKPGVSRQQASAETAVIGAALERERPAEGRSGPPVPLPGADSHLTSSFVWTAEISSPIPYGLRGIAAGFISLLMALVSVVLFIACTNVSGVLLARATARKREIAVRVSSGASRRRLIQQLLTETTLLFLLGGTSGLVLARLMTSLLVSLLPSFPIPVALSVPLDARVVAFSVGLSLLAAVLAGLAPALRASKLDVMSSLKDEGSSSPEHSWLRHAFVVAQVAFSLLLVLTAGLLGRALANVSVLDRDLGFDPRNIDVAAVNLSLAGTGAAAGTQFARELLERVRALPGVEQATVASGAPGRGASMSLGGISVPGSSSSGAEPYYPSWTLITPGYFDTLRIPMLEGRDFTDTDREGTEPVVILGRQAVERFWPGQSGVGRLVRGPSPDPRSAALVQMRVVGVVEDVWPGGPPEMYVPLPQRPWPQLTILARRGDDRSLAGGLRTLITETNPNLPVLYAQTLLSVQENGPVETQLKVAAAVGGSVGLVGLLLAAIGIYGVTSYMVVRRTREIGIRLSLGARGSDVVGLVLRQGMRLVMIGLLIGAFLGAGVGRTLTTRGFGPGVQVPPPDIPTVLAAILVFVAVGLAACVVPVRRASRIQAMDALRYE